MDQPPKLNYASPPRDLLKRAANRKKEWSTEKLILVTGAVTIGVMLALFAIFMIIVIFDS
jgi:hypothetical protein